MNGLLDKQTSLGKERGTGHERARDIFGLVLGKLCPTKCLKWNSADKVACRFFFAMHSYALRWDSSRTVYFDFFLQLSSKTLSATDHGVEFTQDFYTFLWAWAICAQPNTTDVTMLRVQTLLYLGFVRVLHYSMVAYTSRNAAETQTSYFKRWGMKYSK